MSKMDELSALVDRAMSEGALGAEVLRTSVQTRKVRARSTGRPTVRKSGGDEITVRVWVKGGRLGEMTGPPEEGAELVGQALASTFESPENASAGPIAKLGAPTDGLGIRDRRYDQLDDEGRIEVVQDTLRTASTDRRFEAGNIDYYDSLTWRGLSNSRGVHFHEESTTFGMTASISGQGLALEDRVASRSFASIASMPIGVQLVARGAELMQKGRTLEEGPVRVVLPPRAVARLLSEIGDHFTAAELADGSFFLQDLGEVASVSEKLHLVDDGGVTGGLRTRAFDDRGSLPVPLTLLREGVVAGRFLDPTRARRANTRPTGHVWGDSLRSNNLVLRGGTRSINAMLTERGGMSLQVDDLADLKKLSIKTGNIDVTVDGLVMDANKVVGAMRGVRLRGNLLDLLQNVVDVCNNTDRIGHVDAAAIIADGLTLG